MLTLEQRIYIVRSYGLGHEKSYMAVLREFHEIWPAVSLTDKGLKKIVIKFMRTGSVLNKKREKKKYNEDDAVTVMTMDSVRNFPKLSLRKRSSQIGNVSKSLVEKILKFNKIRPYKPKFNHFLEENDDMKRLDFCLLIGEHILRQRSFVNNIIFSDEATFTTNGVVSSQNCRYWSRDNPNFRIRSRRQYSQKVNVWCAITYNGIIGPYFIENNLNQHTYLHLLNTFFMIICKIYL